jgi:hypothetical protein
LILLTRQLRFHRMSSHAGRALLVTVSLITVAGCASTPRGYPLYSESIGRLPVAHVARLNTSMPVGASPYGGAASFIRAVDGWQVSHLDRAFELLPGCHVVETEGRVIVASGNTTQSPAVGSQAFVLHMKPGYEYVVVVEMYEGMTDPAPMLVHTVEKDPSGAPTGTVAPVDPAAAAQACGVS